MSEAELHVLRGRLTAGLENKARRGELVLGLPVGYRLSTDGEIEKDPDEMVQQAIDHVFEKFDEVRSVLAVLNELREEGAHLPYRRDAFGQGGVEWRPPKYQSIMRILAHPIYAGAYVYGRTTTTASIGTDGRLEKRPGTRVENSRWPVLLLDHHSGYISWREHEEIQQRIRANRRGFGQPGPVRGGSSLLAGLVRCGACGRSMSTQYTGAQRDRLRFLCIGETLLAGGRRCQSFGGQRLEKAVSQHLLTILEPKALEAAFLALQDFEKQRVEQLRRWNLEVEKAVQSEDRSRRQFERVEPEDRLVARELERKWETNLQALQEAQRVCDRKKASLPPPLSEEERKDLRRALSRLPELWSAPTTPPESRKEIARILIRRVEVRAERVTRLLHFAVHWMTGQVTPGTVKVPHSGEHRWVTPEGDLGIIRRLSRDHTDGEIAKALNSAGRTTPHGNPWTAARVHSVAMAHRILHWDPDASATSLTWGQAKERWGISYSSFRRLLRERKLHAVHSTSEFVIHSPPRNS